MEMDAWAGLNPDLLLMIVKRIKFAEDFIKFGAVCTTWRDAVCSEGSTESLEPLRWLMLPPDKNKKQDHIREFYSLTRDKIYKISLPVETKEKRVIETKGWLLTVSVDRELSLVHPFSRHVITLPPQSAFGEYFDNSEPLWFVKKGVLSSSPCSSSCHDYTLMVIFGGSFRLGFWEPGCQTWTVIETPDDGLFEDIIYSRDKFYAIDRLGEIYQCDVRGCDPTVAVPIGSIPLHGLCNLYKFYLAECVEKSYRFPRKGLVIVRLITEFGYTTAKFRVYEVDFTVGKWKIVNHLGGRALFVGHNETVCIGPLENPHGIIEADHIYYTDHCLESYPSPNYGPTRTGPFNENVDMGTYNLKNQTRQSSHLKKSPRALVPVWTFISFTQPCIHEVE